MAESQQTIEDDATATEDDANPSSEETPSGTRQRLRGIVNRFSVLRPNWTMRPTLASLRWPRVAERESRVMVHVVNVGEGEAMLVEFEEEPGMMARVAGHTNKVYLIGGGDGSDESMANLYQCLEMKGCLPPSPNKGQLLLNGILVTSPNANHMAGVSKLLAHVKENGWKYSTPILISERFINTLPSHVIELFQLMSTELYRGLTFVPTPLPDTAEPDDETQENLYFHSSKDQALLCMQGATKKPDSNWTNLLETIQNRDLLFTSGLTYDQLTDGHKLKEKHVKVFQVPHDIDNLTTDEWYSFYSSFTAEFYLLPGGARGGETEGGGGVRKEILQGIIKACVQRGASRACTILVSNSQGLDAEKLSELESQEMKWYSKIRICHLNDLFHDSVTPQDNTSMTLPQQPINPAISQVPSPPHSSTATPPESTSSNENTPQHHPFNNTGPTDHGVLQLESQPEEEGRAISPLNEPTTLPPPQFITIDLKSGVVNPECVLEWSPQTYIHLLRCCIDRGLTLVSGKLTLPFFYNGVVTIKKENTGHYIGIKEDGLPKGYSVEKRLHIICTPVPHKPWNGPGPNLCYVIQETIERSTIESFQKVVFLAAEGEGVCYKMFGYDNNQWKIRHYKSTFVVKSEEET